MLRFDSRPVCSEVTRLGQKAEGASLPAARLSLLRQLPNSSLAVQLPQLCPCRSACCWLCNGYHPMSEKVLAALAHALSKALMSFLPCPRLLHIFHEQAVGGATRKEMANQALRSQVEALRPAGSSGRAASEPAAGAHRPGPVHHQPFLISSKTAGQHAGGSRLQASAASRPAGQMVPA